MCSIYLYIIYTYNHTERVQYLLFCLVLLLLHPLRPPPNITLLSFFREEHIHYEIFLLMRSTLNLAKLNLASNRTATEHCQIMWTPTDLHFSPLWFNNPDFPNLSKRPEKSRNLRKICRKVPKKVEICAKIFRKRRSVSSEWA
jgi:hypothetical protein